MQQNEHKRNLERKKGSIAFLKAKKYATPQVMCVQPLNCENEAKIGLRNSDGLCMSQFEHSLQSLCHRRWAANGPSATATRRAVKSWRKRGRVNICGDT